MAWPSIVNISQMHCFFRGRQLIKTKQTEKQQQRYRREEEGEGILGEKSCYSVFGVWKGGSAKGCADECTPMHTYVLRPEGKIFQGDCEGT